MHETDVLLGAYQYVINSVPLLFAKFEHLLPVSLLVLILCQTIQFQYFCCDKILFIKKERKNGGG